LTFSNQPQEITHFIDAIEGNKSYYQKLPKLIKQNAKIYRHGRLKGRLIGGNLSIIEWLSGTNYTPTITNGDILFIEDDEDASGNLWQTYLQKLKMLGYFEKLSGLIIGQTPFTKFNPEASMKDILDIVVGDYNFPVIYAVHFGHLRDNTIINFEEGLDIDITI
jgi:muramoyltetrapeptide carboxypeptidase